MPNQVRVIVAALDSFARARGNADIEYVVCRMTKGKDQVFEVDDPEYEEFEKDNEAYWNARGWTYRKEGDRHVLSYTRHATQ